MEELLKKLLTEIPEENFDTLKSLNKFLNIQYMGESLDSLHKSQEVLFKESIGKYLKKSQDFFSISQEDFSRASWRNTSRNSSKNFLWNGASWIFSKNSCKYPLIKFLEDFMS